MHATSAVLGVAILCSMGQQLDGDDQVASEAGPLFRFFVTEPARPEGKDDPFVDADVYKDKEKAIQALSRFKAGARMAASWQPEDFEVLAWCTVVGASDQMRHGVGSNILGMGTWASKAHDKKSYTLYHFTDLGDHWNLANAGIKGAVSIRAYSSKPGDSEIADFLGKAGFGFQSIFLGQDDVCIVSSYMPSLKKTNAALRVPLSREERNRLFQEYRRSLGGRE
jgi:hypothetical protein